MVNGDMMAEMALINKPYECAKYFSPAAMVLQRRSLSGVLIKSHFNIYFCIVQSTVAKWDTGVQEIVFFDIYLVDFNVQCTQVQFLF